MKEMKNGKDGADEERDKRGGGRGEQREVTAAAEITDWK